MVQVHSSQVIKMVTPISIILFAVVLRLLPHPPNFAPIAAMALFGGVYLSKKYALIVPLIAMLVSDVFIGFHSTMPFVYGSFLFTGLIGLWVKNHKTLSNIIFSSLTGSFVFFFVTNFGVWIVESLYPKTLPGLIDCYFYALPFFRNTVFGDLFYVALFFGSYELVRRFVFAPIFLNKKRYE